jgi:membrane associated rhomboid family serine protease
MLVAITFCAIFVVFHVLHGYNITYLSEDFIWSSWASVCDGKYWVLVTATFVHASNSHLINNIATLLAPSQSIEENIGPYGFAFLFVITGIVGWLTSILHNSIRHSQGGWQWIASCGSSPATYGFMFFLVAVDPQRQLHRQLSWLCVGVVISVEFHMLMNRGAQKVKHTLDRKFSVGLLLLIIATCCSLLLIDREITSGQFLYIYVLKSLLFRAVTVMVINQGVMNHSSSDHGAHFGGSLTGTVIGTLLSYGHGGPLHGAVAVMPALVLLLVRLLTDF